MNEIAYRLPGRHRVCNFDNIFPVSSFYKHASQTFDILKIELNTTFVEIS